MTEKRAKERRQTFAMRCNAGKVQVFTSTQPGALEMTEEEACRRLLAFDDLLDTCKAVKQWLIDLAHGMPHWGGESKVDVASKLSKALAGWRSEPPSGEGE